MAKRKAAPPKTGRPAKPAGPSAQIRMDGDIASMAKVVASVEGITMTDLLSRILRPILTERVKRAGRKLLSGDK